MRRSCGGIGGGYSWEEESGIQRAAVLVANQPCRLGFERELHVIDKLLTERGKRAWGQLRGVRHNVNDGEVGLWRKRELGGNPPGEPANAYRRSRKSTGSAPDARESRKRDESSSVALPERG